MAKNKGGKRPVCALCGKAIEPFSGRIKAMDADEERVVSGDVRRRP